MACTAAQVRGAFATLSMGMRTLAGEGVRIDEISAHGGMFRTKGAAQRLLAAALGAPVAVSDTAGEGGAWGMALLARYAAEARRGEVPPLSEWLAARVFGDAAITRGTLYANGRRVQSFLRVYARRAGEWRAVSVQVVP